MAKKNNNEYEQIISVKFLFFLTLISKKKFKITGDIDIFKLELKEIKLNDGKNKEKQAKMKYADLVIYFY